jgi:hypothetical protein
VSHSVGVQVIFGLHFVSFVFGETAEVGKQACCFRILDFIREPYAVIYSRGYAVTVKKFSTAAMRFYSKLKSIPIDTAAHTAITAKSGQRVFVECDAIKWFPKTATQGMKLYECTQGNFENGVAMTILYW